MQRILVVDDDVELAGMVADHLRPEGFSVDVVHDPGAPMVASPEGYDLMLLDVMLPGRTGFEVLKTLRRHSTIPVILLTARDEETDRVLGLEIGADDYVAKPFRLRELAARVRAVLRRTERVTAAPAAELQVGEVRLNPASRRATCRGRDLNLTTAEFDLLERFLRRAGTTVSRDELAQAALGRHVGADSGRNVDTLVSKLRRKLGDEDLIRTVRHVGYLFALPEPAAQG
ncbi:response regulator transcription factor [Roseomonas sp. OT10]|uniref:response regulator transcription factor n=1 Tax=Roseomonas cutis TaxID=2897332 RepID=UPI001E39932C|nr:response regulator transcription factor [Roseomonas sp. OT10]UFN50272.1 response regulator transcription factor [Roseomonas sp. OT10]